MQSHGRIPLPPSHYSIGRMMRPAADGNPPRVRPL